MRPAAPATPSDHPLRRALADELHARPPVFVEPPAVVSFLAIVEAPLAAVLAAVRTLGPAPSLAGGDVAHGIEHFATAGGADLSLKWEQHGEFLTLVVVQPLPAPGPAGGDAPGPWPTAFAALPAGWLERLPGHTLAAGDVLVLPGDAAEADARLAEGLDRDSLAGASVSDAAARAYTDFRLHDGRSRWLLLEDGPLRRATALDVQRLVEIDVYRMTALLGFPVARTAFAQLARLEAELGRVTASTAALPPGGAAHDEERALLEQLSRIAAEVESLHATTAFRFGASQAYWDLVRARLGELREQRQGTLRTPSGFLARRLAPAMESCAAAARRQEHLSARVERASALLRTRVDVAREEQNQRILAAMERRGKLQLRLQQTVERLSLVAIVYYAVGLLAWLLKPLGDRVPTGWIVAAAIPLLALLGVAILRRARHRHDAG